MSFLLIRENKDVNKEFNSRIIELSTITELLYKAFKVLVNVLTWGDADVNQLIDILSTILCYFFGWL